MRDFLRATAQLAAAACIGAAALAHAADAPALKLVVPYPAGGPADIVARIIAPAFAEQLGRPVIVDNRAGANGTIGAAMVANAAPDGNTLLLNPTIHVILPSLQARLPYDAIADFTHLGVTAGVPLLLAVNNELPVRSVKELVAHAKASPGRVNFATSAKGSSSHLSAEQLRLMAGIEIQHIPYKGSAPAITDLMGGQVQMMFDSLTSMYPYARGGKVRALAVTSEKRLATAPQLPTMVESGYPGFVHANWYGIWGPKGMAAETREKLVAGLQHAMQRKDVRDKLLELGAEPIDGIYGARFEEFARSELQRYAKLIADAGIKPE